MHGTRSGAPVTCAAVTSAKEIASQHRSLYAGHESPFYLQRTNVKIRLLSPLRLSQRAGQRELGRQLKPWADRCTHHCEGASDCKLADGALAASCVWLMGVSAG